MPICKLLSLEKIYRILRRNGRKNIGKGIIQSKRGKNV